MSHEIRTPMNAILGMAHLLQRGGVTPQQSERLDKIDAASQHLLGIINDILDISKIEAGKFLLEEAPISFPGLMSNVVAILSERIKVKGLQLHVETEPLPSNLLGDPTRLQQALLNYATNAYKFRLFAFCGWTSGFDGALELSRFVQNLVARHGNLAVRYV